jgi:hypothetical protein
VCGPLKDCAPAPAVQLGVCTPAAYCGDSIAARWARAASGNALDVQRRAQPARLHARRLKLASGVHVDDKAKEVSALLHQAAEACRDRASRMGVIVPSSAARVNAECRSIWFKALGVPPPYWWHASPRAASPTSFGQSAREVKLSLGFGSGSRSRRSRLRGNHPAPCTVKAWPARGTVQARARCRRRASSCARGAPLRAAGSS